MSEDKKAYEEYAKAKIKEIDARMQELQAKAEQSKAEARMETEKELEEARRKKDWVEADRLRDELAAIGVQVLDTAAGTRWRRLDH